MLPPSADKTSRRLSRWHVVRILAGLTMIVAIVVMVGRAVVALQAGHDTSTAMKVPFYVALASGYIFVRCVRHLTRQKLPRP